jgi:hypothetical protein
VKEQGTETCVESKPAWEARKRSSLMVCSFIAVAAVRTSWIVSGDVARP